MRAALLAPVTAADVRPCGRMRGADDKDTKRTIQWGAAAAAESQVPGSGELASDIAGRAFDYGASFNKNKDCVKGQDPNDPECDGTQVVSGVRICGPNEDPSSGCVRDTNTRGAPALSAFPEREIDLTGRRAREAQRTREAQAQYEADRDAEANPRLNERSSAPESALELITRGAVMYAAGGAIAGGAGRRTWKAAGVGAGIGAAMGATLATIGVVLNRRYGYQGKTP